MLCFFLCPHVLVSWVSWRVIVPSQFLPCGLYTYWYFLPSQKKIVLFFQRRLVRLICSNRSLYFRYTVIYKLKREGGYKTVLLYDLALSYGQVISPIFDIVCATFSDILISFITWVSLFYATHHRPEVGGRTPYFSSLGTNRP